MEIKIIPNEQTPKLKALPNPETWGVENKELLDACAEFLEKAGRNPVGLAANQISIDGKRCEKRFFIEKANLNAITSEWNYIINPKIVEKIGMTFNVIEGCLTWESENVRSVRHNRVKVSYYTTDGEFKEEEIHGFRAHIWQHEINHLDGVEEDIVNIEVTVENPKVLRNDPCPCKSGKKYKKCCEPYIKL